MDQDFPGKVTCIADAFFFFFDLDMVLALRKGNLVFNIMFGKFLFDGDFSVRNLDAGVELRHYKSSSAFDFSMNKDFSIFRIF